MSSEYHIKVLSPMQDLLPCLDRGELIETPINESSEHYEPTLKAISSLLEVKNELKGQTPSKEHSLLSRYCNLWLSDCYVLVADYSNAIHHYDTPQIGSRNVAERNDNYLTLKLMMDYRIDGSDILRIPAPHLPPLAKKDPDTVANLLTEIVHEYESKHNLNVLKQWQKKHDNVVETRYNGHIRIDRMLDNGVVYGGRGSYNVFSGCLKGAWLSLMDYSFSIPHSNVIFSLEMIYKACFSSRTQALAWERRNKTLSFWRELAANLTFEDW